MSSARAVSFLLASFFSEIYCHLKFAMGVIQGLKDIQNGENVERTLALLK